MPQDWEFHAKPAFFCNILNDNQYIDALITELFQICLVVNLALLEKVHFKMSSLVCLGKAGGVTSDWGEQVRTVLRFALWSWW